MGGYVHSGSLQIRSLVTIYTAHKFCLRWVYVRYQCLGNHDIVPGQPGVDFQTKVAPIYDDRWYFVSPVVQKLRTEILTEQGYRATAILYLWSCRCRLDRNFRGRRFRLLPWQLPKSLFLLPFPSPSNTSRTHPSTETPTQKPATTQPKPKSTSSTPPSRTPTPPGNSCNCITLTSPQQKTTPSSLHSSRSSPSTKASWWTAMITA